MNEFMRMRSVEGNAYKGGYQHFQEDNNETREFRLMEIATNETCKSKKYLSGYIAAAKDANFKSYWMDQAITQLQGERNSCYRS